VVVHVVGTLEIDHEEKKWTVGYVAGIRVTGSLMSHGTGNQVKNLRDGIAGG